MAEKANIKAMFDDIAPTYDKLNHILSLGIDNVWRRKAARYIESTQPGMTLDISCGTADSSIALAKCGVNNIVGIDISEGMLAVGRKKVASLGLSDKITLCHGDGENLEFEDGSADAVLVAFGIRNFEDIISGLKEIWRVLSKGGVLIVLELSVPHNSIMRFLYNLYFKNMTPFIGKIISGNNYAYHYLPDSVNNFYAPKEFMNIMIQCGFEEVRQKALSLGLCRMFSGRKS